MALEIWQSKTRELFSCILQDEHDFGVYKDRITDSTSAVVHSPKNKSSSNGAEAKPSSSDCHIELSSIA